MNNRDDFEAEAKRQGFKELHLRKDDAGVYVNSNVQRAWHFWNAALSTTPSAAKDVLTERERQKQVEGWTPEHDDMYAFGELRKAAVCYALNDRFLGNVLNPDWWPWPNQWWKPASDRRNLVKAAALILAEIERLDRAAVALAVKGE